MKVPRSFVDDFETVCRAYREPPEGVEELRALARANLEWAIQHFAVVAFAIHNGFDPQQGHHFTTWWREHEDVRTRFYAREETAAQS